MQEVVFLNFTPLGKIQEYKNYARITQNKKNSILLPKYCFYLT